MESLDREPEIWCDVPDYEIYYAISSWGNVKTKGRKYENRWGGFNYKPEKILTKCKSNNGYYIVILVNDKFKKTFLVHVLVAKCFLPDYDIGKIVGHLDNNKINNYYKNLECINTRENIVYSIDRKITSSSLVGVHIKKFKKKDKIYSYIYASIYLLGRKVSLGSFKSEEDAHQAYLNALKEYGIENKYAEGNQS